MDAYKKHLGTRSDIKTNGNHFSRNTPSSHKSRTILAKMIRALEFMLLFFGIPLLIYSESLIKHPSLVLLPVLAGLIFYFIYKKDFNLKMLIQLDVPRRVIWNQILLVVATGIFLATCVYFIEPEKLFNLPRENPAIWLVLFFAYPVFSAYSQEVVYRTFLFTRYQSLFKSRNILIVISGVTFAFAHIVYYHPLSIVLTLIAGIYLAWIYRRTRSVLFTTILHSILGILVFTVGLGEYFWLNMESHL